LCKVATISEIEGQGWSLNPGRYVGIEAAAEEDFVFAERLASLRDEFMTLSDDSKMLASRITGAISEILPQV
jgi:type I restriction enzyme M protein